MKPYDLLPCLQKLAESFLKTVRLRRSLRKNAAPVKSRCGRPGNRCLRIQRQVLITVTQTQKTVWYLTFADTRHERL